MLGAVALNLLSLMDESAPKRGVPPVNTTGPLPQRRLFVRPRAARERRGSRRARSALCLATCRAFSVGHMAASHRPPVVRCRPTIWSGHAHQSGRTTAVVPAPSRRRVPGVCPDSLWNRIRDIARQYQRTGPPDPLDTDMAGKEDSPLDLAIGHETLERYEAALERLRPEEKELIIARIEMGLPHAEIAVMFDKPSVAAVHMALSRALVRLAEEMAHERKR